MCKKLLIFDLDETLIHGAERPLERSADFSVGPFDIYERPHMRAFMSFCRKHFKVAIWTTATENYAETILHTICGDDYPFEFIWCRDRCTIKGESYDGELRWSKDLKKLKRLGWSLDQVLVVEDKPENLSRHYGNVIRIVPFEGDQNDIELRRLMPFLLEMESVGNVRKIEKRGWRSRFSSDLEGAFCFNHHPVEPPQ